MRRQTSDMLYSEIMKKESEMNEYGIIIAKIEGFEDNTILSNKQFSHMKLKYTEMMDLYTNIEDLHKKYKSNESSI
jgi:hypothetical protein